MMFRISFVVFVLSLAGCQKENNTLKLYQIDKLLEQQQYDQALSLCHVDNEQDALDVDLLLRKAIALKELKQYEAAETALLSASQIDQENPQIKKTLAELNLTTGKAEEAQKLFESITTKNIKKSSVFNSLGVSLDLQGYHVAAQEQYKKAISLAPNNENYQSNLGMSLAFSNNLTEALVILKPIMIHTKNRHNLALVYAMNHQLDEFHTLLEGEMDEVERIALLDNIRYNLK